MTCMVPLITPGMYVCVCVCLNATHIFLCHFCYMQTTTVEMSRRGGYMCAGIEFLVFAFIIFYSDVTHTGFVLPV
jgi:hypothetical protein